MKYEEFNESLRKFFEACEKHFADSDQGLDEGYIVGILQPIRDFVAQRKLQVEFEELIKQAYLDKLICYDELDMEDDDGYTKYCSYTLAKLFEELEPKLNFLDHCVWYYTTFGDIDNFIAKWSGFPSNYKSFINPH